jgi:Fe-S-cluster containining protein
MANPCTLCDASCCTDLYITVTIFDIIRICDRLGQKPEEFSQLYPLRLINFDNDTVLEMHDRKYLEEHILCLNSHPCVFLKGKRCEIHGFSPSVCTAFPKGIDGRWKTRLCPAVSGLMFRTLGFGAQLRPAYLWELGTYKEIVAQWNRKRGRKADCMEFLLARAREELKSRHASAPGAGQGAAQAASRRPL